MLPNIAMKKNVPVNNRPYPVIEAGVHSSLPSTGKPRVGFGTTVPMGQATFRLKTPADRKATASGKPMPRCKCPNHSRRA
jgi:hypothetical protein